MSFFIRSAAVSQSPPAAALDGAPTIGFVSSPPPPPPPPPFPPPIPPLKMWTCPGVVQPGTYSDAEIPIRVRRHSSESAASGGDGDVREIPFRAVLREADLPRVDGAARRRVDRDLLPPLADLDDEQAGAFPTGVLA